MSSTGESTKNCIPDAMANRPMSNIKIGLRPHLSAAQPPIGEPIRMPIRAAAAIRPCQNAVSCRSSAILPDTGPMMPRT
ncbi:hypothetical protein D3C79_1068200 [compost metagenome]